MAGGLTGLKAGDEATAIVDQKDGKDLVTKIVLEGDKKKKKKAAGANYKIVDVDTGKSTITLSVDGKNKTLVVDKSASIQAPGKKKMLQDVSGGLSGLKAGSEATVTIEKKDGKDLVTKIVVAAARKKKAS